MKYSFVVVNILFSVFFFGARTSQAVQYFYYDAESDVEGMELPHNVVSGPEFCQTECSGSGTRGRIISGNTPQGEKYFRWTTVDDQTNAYTQVTNIGTFHAAYPLDFSFGDTFYLAYMIRYDRINGIDVFNTTIPDCGEKGVEIDGSGVRWMLSCGGIWGEMTNTVPNKWTIWPGNPTYHLNDGNPAWEPLVEYPTSNLTPLNASGYSVSNPIALDYERWYAFVMKVKANSSPYSEFNMPDGEMEAWVNGVKVGSYLGIWTVGNETDNSISQIEMLGTIQQGCTGINPRPAHYISYDALILTDDWADITNGGYLEDPLFSDTTAPGSPLGLAVW